MSDSDTPSVGALKDRVDALDPSTADADELADTLVALADAYGRRGEFDAEASTIDRLEDLHSDHPEAGIHHQLARALANATAVEEREDAYEGGINPERIETHRARLETLYGGYSELPIAIELAQSTAQTAHAYGKAERPDRIVPLIERLEDLYESHQETEIAGALARGHAHAELSFDPDDDGADENRVDRVERLYEATSDGEVAAGFAGVIAGRTNADVPSGDVEAVEDRIARIESLAQQHPEADEEITRWLPIAAANATRASFEGAEYERLKHWGRRTVTHHEELGTESSAKWAAVATFYSARGSFFDAEIDAGEVELERLRELEDSYEEPVFDHWLARSMFDAARGYAETGHYEKARSMAEELEEYAEGHQDREQIEAGLEALAEQAPGLFGDEEPAHASHGATDAVASGDGGATPHTGDVETPTTQQTSGPAGEELDQHAVESQSQELAEAVEMLEQAEDSGGCGSGSCGSCGSSQPAEPASGPTLAAAATAAAVVTISLVYGLYRLVKVGAATIAGGE